MELRPPVPLLRLEGGPDDGRADTGRSKNGATGAAERFRRGAGGFVWHPKLPAPWTWCDPWVAEPQRE